MLHIDANPSNEFRNSMGTALSFETIKFVQMEEPFCIPGTFEDQYGQAGDYIILENLGYNLRMIKKDFFEKNYFKPHLTAGSEYVVTVGGSTLVRHQVV